MATSIALKRYFDRHIEPDLPEVPAYVARWRNVLVIPAYDESPELLDTLSKSLLGPERVLVILVLNRPESSGDLRCNNPFREAIEQRKNSSGNTTELLTLNQHCDLYVHDMERLRGPSPPDEGVGLARKVGCDIALSWWRQGHVTTDWICSSDADATLPKDYFEKLKSVPETSAAATLPFQHMPGPDSEVNLATLLYELRMHHYVLGLDFAGSGYAYHTLGSTLAVKCESYAQVRGFPKRAGGEDFYLLNKIAKTGAVERLRGQCIELESRASTRVPFGTGPAVGKIVAGGEQIQQPLFYHPQCFYALRAVLATVPTLREKSALELPTLLQHHSLDTDLAQACYETLINLGLEKILEHCSRQSKSAEQYTRQFHQWFDGFRTLKFIHALRERDWKDQNLKGLSQTAPTLWPGQSDQWLNVEGLCIAIHEHWDWSNGAG